MASQRDPKKKLVGGFYDQQLKDAIMRIAMKRRQSMSEAVLQLLIEGLLRMGIELPPEVLVLYKGELSASLRAKIAKLPPKPKRKRRVRLPDGTLVDPEVAKEPGKLGKRRKKEDGTLV